MRLSFKYIVNNAKDNQVKIVDDLMWHVCKVMNIFTYGIRQKEFKINFTGSINLESSKIYKYFRESNWHSKYLHSHTLQEAKQTVIASEKSYNELKKIYEKDNTSLKGEPKEPRYRNQDMVEVVFTKYAIRHEGKYIKISLSKEMQKKYQVKSLNFLISNKLRKLVDFEHVKMIKIRKIQGKIELNIIYEKEEQKVKETNTNIVGIDLGLTNIVACTNRDNAETLIVSGGPIKSRNRYIMERISYLQKVQMHMDKDAKYYKNTKQINRLYEKRRNYIETYMLHRIKNGNYICKRK